MSIVYIDRFSLSSLYSVFKSGRGCSRVYYFDIAAGVQPLVNIFLKLRVLHVRPQALKFRLGEITDEQGECQFARMVGDLTEICKTIEIGELRSNEIVLASTKVFEPERLFLFFKKIIASDIQMPVVYLNVARRHSSRMGGDRVFVILRNHFYFSYLSDYAEKLGLTLSGHGIMRRADYFKSHFGRFQTIIKQSFQKAIKASPGIVRTLLRSRSNTAILETAKTGSNSKPKLAALFTGRTVAFDLKRRSDFFWLLKSHIPYERVLLYLGAPNLTINQDMVDRIRNQRLNLGALSRSNAASLRVPVWRSSLNIREFLRLSRPIFQYFIKHPLRNYFYFIGMLYFISKYLRWFEIFKAHNIKVNLNPTDFIEAQIPMQQALEDAGGVSVSYHWSNIDFTSIFMSNCADVLFSFGPAYRAVFEKSQAVVDTMVYCGYITDYAFKKVTEDALKLREKLLSRGAKFILCFFDESSADTTMSIVTNEKSTNTYRYFIERMLRDESLGLIFKPGYPTTIYDRISPISDLIAKAKATGRCVFIDKGTYVSETYPSGAAQAADLSVGFLISGTVALESHLSGTPTVFLDLEKLYSNPIYKWGKGKVVFDTMDGLFSAIDKHRRDPAAVPGFGDLSKWAEGKDPFRDGRASERIGQYLNWLLKEFDEGRTRQEAIANANSQYRAAWGVEAIQ